MQRSVISAGTWAVVLVTGSLLKWASVTTQISDLTVTTSKSAWELGSLLGIPAWAPVVLALIGCVAVVFEARRLVWLTTAAAILLFLAIGAIFTLHWLQQDGPPVGPGVWVCLFAAVGLLVTTGRRSGRRQQTVPA